MKTPTALAHVVVTSIHPPTEAVRRMSRYPHLRTVVVGDAKSPAKWQQDGVDYWPLERQGEIDAPLAAKLPENHYSRKMLGYVHAMRCGASAIVDTDDDNLPLGDWRFPDMTGRFFSTLPQLGFVNVYRHFTSQFIWPRGFPLELVRQPACWRESLSEQVQQVAIWQGLAQHDPDVDAIYRLVLGQACQFDEAPALVLSPGTVCPFNSQNTWFSKAAFPLLYIPSQVSFRFCDILRGLVAQPILWRMGLRLGFCSAHVRQERHPHDLMSDFQSEWPMHAYGSRVVDWVNEALGQGPGAVDWLHDAYVALARHGVVPGTELGMLEAWLAAMSRTRPLA
ncbi:MAG: hypothetical protein RIT26_211 [Pseudomonadota bacterium]|jgi:hypothetical protein